MIYSVEDIKEHGKNNTYIAHGEKSNAECVLGFSFGFIEVNSNVFPGISNEQLAKYIEENFTSTPLILQHEIADALQNRTADFIIEESREKGVYLNSREIALQALEYMKKNNWNKVAVVTHPAMEARNDAMCTKLGMVTIAPEGLGVIQYDFRSAQPWTRDPNSWWEREETVIDVGKQNEWI